ncbi:MAG: MATE family efflux transporter [Sulfuricurvum sp.]|nr:MATE family efflux transporter [Sulfuricurvum sp.]
MHIDLTQGDIKVQLKKLAVPASVGFFFHTMYNVTDTYFAGLISTQALSALTLSFSIFFMMIAVAGGMSEAVTALVGNALGEKNREKAVHIALNALLFALILSLVLTIIGIVSTPYLMMLLGAKGAYLEESLAYINVILYGSAFFVFSFFINALLNAVGDTVSFRNILIVSSLLNIVLDYWFVMGGLGIDPLGVSGIAFATVITEFITVIYLFYKLNKTPLLDTYREFSLDRSVFKAFITQGFPPSVNMIMMATGIFIMTYFAAPFGQEVIAAFGIGMRIEQIILMPAIGLNVAVLAIVSQNNGARQFERIEKTRKISLYYGAIISFAGMLVLLVGAEQLMHFFSDDWKVIEAGSLYLRVEAFILFSFVVIFVHLALLQGIEKPAFIFYISIFRQIIAPILMLSLLTFFGLGVFWIWVSIALIVTFSAFVTWRYSRQKLTEVSKCQGEGNRN